MCEVEVGGSADHKRNILWSVPTHPYNYVYINGQKQKQKTKEKMNRFQVSVCQSHWLRLLTNTNISQESVTYFAS